MIEGKCPGDRIHCGSGGLLRLYPSPAKEPAADRVTRMLAEIWRGTLPFGGWFYPICGVLGIYARHNTRRA